MDSRRSLPAVHRLCTPERISRYGRARVTGVAREVLAEVRGGSLGSAVVDVLEAIEGRIDERLRVGARAVINGTGVLLHTNLGRAPWSEAAIEAVRRAAGYGAVEIDLGTGRRGGRGAGLHHRLCALTGFEAALVVNNCAAAVLLALTATADGREVVLSRGELVEIGGGFRVPDVMEASGATLVAVGTTNRTHLRDFEAALTPQTAAVLRVHHSNFRQIGFVTQPSMQALGELGPPLIVDLGSGALESTTEPSVAEALNARAALVCLSGDKLLGGPQSGIILGTAEAVAACARHPLMRALRPGKVTLAALEATIDDWLVGREVPLEQMRKASMESLRVCVEGWLAALPEGVDARVVEVEGAVGGGTLPGRTWPSVALGLRTPAPERLRAALLRGQTPVLVRVKDAELLIDARAIAPLDQGPLLLALLLEALGTL